MAPNSDPEHRELDAADRHIAVLKLHIAHQRRVITKLRLAKEPTDMARSRLAALEGSLRVFERHRELILNNLKKDK
jgi:predicted transcriptional regulator